MQGREAEDDSREDGAVEGTIYFQEGAIASVRFHRAVRTESFLLDLAPRTM